MMMVSYVCTRSLWLGLDYYALLVTCARFATKGHAISLLVGPLV